MIPGFDLPEFIRAVGYLGLFGIVFAETGLLIGFFLPGDSLLFTAGILAGQGYLNIWLTLLLMTSAAIMGNSVGYLIGKKFGPRVFSKDESLLFNKKHVKRAEDFFEKYGIMTLIIARFVPIVRTFVPVVAGVGKMNYGKFMLHNILGALLWINSVTLLGYYLGLTVPDVEKYIIPGVVLIILLSISPYIRHFIKSPEMRAQAGHYVKKVWRKLTKQTNG